MDQRMDGAQDEDQVRKNAYKIFKGCKYKQKRKIKIRKRLSFQDQLFI